MVAARPQMSAADEAVVRDYVAANRDALRKAYRSVLVAARGRVMGNVDLGLDPTRDHPTDRWWARARLQGGRAGVEVLVEGHASGLEALDDLARQISRRLRAAARRRR